MIVFNYFTSLRFVRIARLFIELTSKIYYYEQKNN